MKLRDKYDLKMIYYLKNLIFPSPISHESKPRAFQHLFAIGLVYFLLSELGLSPITLTSFL